MRFCFRIEGGFGLNPNPPSILKQNLIICHRLIHMYNVTRLKKNFFSYFALIDHLFHVTIIKCRSRLNFTVMVVTIQELCPLKIGKSTEFIEKMVNQSKI
jgi:hypothetical protein